MSDGPPPAQVAGVRPLPCPGGSAPPPPAAHLGARRCELLLTNTCFLSGKEGARSRQLSHLKPFSQWIFTEQKSSVYVT